MRNSIPERKEQDGGPGTEQYEWFSLSHRPTLLYVEYEYRTVQNLLFQTVGPSLDECRRQRDQWLTDQENKKKAAG